MKNWIGNRLTWLDANMPGNCQNDVVASQNLDLLANELTIKAYPNPFFHSTTIEIGGLSNIGAELYLFDLSGKLVHHQADIYTSSIEINVVQLEAGLYFAELRSGEKVGRIKLIVK